MSFMGTENFVNLTAAYNNEVAQMYGEQETIKIAHYKPGTIVYWDCGKYSPEEHKFVHEYVPSIILSATKPHSLDFMNYTIIVLDKSSPCGYKKKNVSSLALLALPLYYHPTGCIIELIRVICRKG